MPRANRNPERLPAYNSVRDDLIYDDGILFWRHGSGNRAAGSIAGGLNKTSGYWAVMWRGIPFQRARLIWYMFNGTSPLIVDHINGLKTDDRIENLRAATEAQNNQNRAILATSRVGLKGLHKLKNGKYRARISVNKRRYLIGDFPDALAAHAAYALRAMAEFGDFARSK